MPANPTNLLPAAVAVFLGWRVFRRVRRNIGRQPLQTKRMMVRIVLYSFLTALLSVASLLFGGTTVLMALAGGLVVGAGLGVYGLELTKFERTPEGRFYTPNRYIGVGVSALLVGRLAYRLILFSGVAGEPPAQPQLMQSPLTLFLFGLLAGYYVAYFTGVLLKGRSLGAS
jgi:hypothetical protein